MQWAKLKYAFQYSPIRTLPILFLGTKRAEKPAYLALASLKSSIMIYNLRYSQILEELARVPPFWGCYSVFELWPSAWILKWTRVQAQQCLVLRCEQQS